MNRFGKWVGKENWDSEFKTSVRVPEKYLLTLTINYQDNKYIYFLYLYLRVPLKIWIFNFDHDKRHFSMWMITFGHGRFPKLNGFLLQHAHEKKNLIPTNDSLIKRNWKTKKRLTSYRKTQALYHSSNLSLSLYNEQKKGRN